MGRDSRDVKSRRDDWNYPEALPEHFNLEIFRD
jgi:hypothetical protein